MLKDSEVLLHTCATFQLKVGFERTGVAEILDKYTTFWISVVVLIDVQQICRFKCLILIARLEGKRPTLDYFSA